MAKKFLVTAINGKTKSLPFVLYTTEETVFEGQAVLRIDEDVNRSGEPTLKLSNGNLGLIVSHQPEYITERLTGFRRDVKDVTCVIVERFVDNLPTVSAAAKGKVY